MCDQTEVIYSAGDVVWVKLGPVWWPGEVYDYEKLPEEITSNLRKKPIAVVKFFQEDSYEYVKNLNHIYHYNCRRKHEFIKKGLDMCRSNSREVPSNMKMFPNDVVTAEHLTNGNINILEKDEFKPEEKEDYSELFGKKTPKKGKNDSFKKDFSSWKIRSFADTSHKKKNNVPSPITRPITHPRFISKAREGKSDHVVRIRQQSIQSSDDETPRKYNCHLCGFSASRINVMVYHNKSHNGGYADAYIRKPEKTKKASLSRLSYGTEKRPRLSEKYQPDDISFKRKTPKISTSNSTPKPATPAGKSKDVSTTITTTTKDVTSTPSVRKPIFGKKKTAKEKAEKIAKEKEQNDAFRETLLKDWDFEDEDTMDEEENKTEEEVKTDDSSKEDGKENSKTKEIIKSESDKAEGSKDSPYKQKQTSCFDFDDSEDGLNIGETVMKFGRKIPRVLGDKPKKRSGSLEDAEVSDVKSTDTEQEKDSSIAQEDKKTEAEEKGLMPDKEKAELDLAFKNLLEETSVPVIRPISPPEKMKPEKAGSSPEKDDYEYNQENLQKDIEEELILDDAVEEEKNKETDVKNENIVEEKGGNKDSHFLVKTSEEVATASSDDVPLGVNTPSESNVAALKTATADTSVSGETNDHDTKPVPPIKSQINDIVSDFISETPNKESNVEKTVVKAAEPKALGNAVEGSKITESQANKTTVEKQTVADPNSFQEMDFDINSMPVIISDDAIVHEQDMSSQLPTPVLKPEVKESKVVAIKPKRTADAPVFVKKEEQIVSKQAGTKTVSKKPLVLLKRSGAQVSQVATIKVPSASGTTQSKISVPGLVTQKSGTSQVLILKSTTPGQPGKSTLTKLGSSPQVIQQAGGKVLILTNPQGGAQGKILTTLATQQKVLAPTKLTGTRILTTKGTVLTTGTQQTVISKANILNTGKTVTTKSGQKILINKSGIVSHTPKSVIINKSNVLTPTSTVVPKTTQQSVLTSKIETAQTGKLLTTPLTTSKGMVLTPVSSKGVTLVNNQKLRVITSKASSTSGTKLMIQSPSRVILPSSLQKNQQLMGNIKAQNTGTMLIQTSQGMLTTTPIQKSVTKVVQKAVPTSLAQKTSTIQVAQSLPKPAQQGKVVIQKMKGSGPNILQKQQKKPAQKSVAKKNILTPTVTTPVQTMRAPVTVNTVSTAIPGTSQETLILPTGSTLPVLSRSVQSSSDSNQTALVYLTVDESGNYRPLETTPVVNYEGGTSAESQQQTLYIDPGTTDLDNIFLAIDDAGNVVNISQPIQNITTENPTPNPPSQDILAKALANTQVLQQETIATENISTSSVDSSMLGCMFVEPQQAQQYPAPTLSHSVLETSLTLNQPIMTPLEVPSAVSPRGLNQISALPTTFLNDSTLLTAGKDTTVTQPKVQNPSMPLLTEESETAPVKNEAVFLTQVSVDGSTVLTPVTAGSQLFQFTLDETNAIASSSSGIPSLITTTDIQPSSLAYITTTESTLDQKPTLVKSAVLEESYLGKPMDNTVSNSIDMPSIAEFEAKDEKPSFVKTNGIDQLTEESTVVSSAETQLLISSNTEISDLDQSAESPTKTIEVSESVVSSGSKRHLDDTEGDEFVKKVKVDER